jgi:hypothetical protein
VALCNAVADAFAAADFLADGFAGGRLVSVAVFLADVFDTARAAFLEGGFLKDAWEDFLRVFLDIRLPFVAFSGSTIAILRVPHRQLEPSWPCWANLPISEYGYNGFYAATRPHFVESALGPDDE